VTDNEDPEGDSSSLNSVLDWGGWLMSSPSRFTTHKVTLYGKSHPHCGLYSGPFSL